MRNDIKRYLGETMDIAVFNEAGELVAKLDTTKRVDVLSEDGYYIIRIADALIDLDLIRFIGKAEKSNDYESYLKKSTSVSFGSKKSVKCKIVASSILRDMDKDEPYDVTIEFPNAEIKSDLEIRASVGHSSPFDIYVKVNEFNEEGDFLRISF